MFLKGSNYLVNIAVILVFLGCPMPLTGQEALFGALFLRPLECPQFRFQNSLMSSVKALPGSNPRDGEMSGRTGGKVGQGASLEGLVKASGGRCWSVRDWGERQ